MDNNLFINFEAGRKFLANDHLLFLKRFFETDLESSSDSLTSSHTKQNWIELKRSAHILKSTSAYIGALTCSKLAEALQLACAETPLNEKRVSSLVKDLLDHLRSLYQYLSSYFHPVEFKLASVKISESKAENSLFEEMKNHLPAVTIKKIAPPITKVTIIEKSVTVNT